MACMEHICVECGHVTFNNVSTMYACPRCGGQVASSFDEPINDHDDLDAYFDHEPDDDDHDDDGA